MHSTKKTKVIKTRVDIKPHIPKSVWVNKFNHYKRCINEILQQKELLYLEIDALGAGLLQVRDRMRFSKVEVPNNSAVANSIHKQNFDQHQNTLK